jgi:hypothetical protein
MESVSQWAGIESGAGSPPSARDVAAPARVKRQERMVLGSIDGAAHVLQRHAREVVFGSAIFLVPVIALNLILSTLLFDRFDSFDGAVVSLPELTGGIRAATGAETLLAYFSVLTTSLAVALIGGYLMALLLRQQGGLPVTLGSSLRAVGPRLPAVFGAWLISHLWLFLAALLLVQVNGSELAPFAVLLVPGGVLLLALLLFVSPVVVTERCGPWRALRRALRLGRLRFGACLGFVVVAAVIGVGLRLGITLLPRLAATTGLITFGSYGWLVEGVAGQFAQLIAVPLVALATAQFYLQVRMHAEGMDIVVAADRAFGSRRPDHG